MFCKDAGICLPLIEPYGIEITFPVLNLAEAFLPLIEPYGIEIAYRILSCSRNTRPLIEPYGIEIAFIVLRYGYRFAAFNRTLWNWNFAMVKFLACIRIL